MKRILIVGSGDVALRALPWLTRRFRVFALVRQPDTAVALRAAGAIPIAGDLDDRRSLKRLAGLADAVLHFAPPPSSGRGDPRTQHLLAALESRKSLPQGLVYISTTGVYGDCGGAHVDETRPCNAQTARGRRRVDAEHRLRAFCRRTGVRVALLRAVCDEFWLVSHGGITSFDGALDAYQQFLLDEARRVREEIKAISREEKAQAAPPAPSPSANKKITPQMKSMRRDLAKTELRLAELHAQKTALEARLLETLSPQEIGETGLELQTLAETLDALEEQWLTISAWIENEGN